MIEYTLVKYCRLCKKRFLISRTDKKENYCKDCLKKFAKEDKNGRES